MTNNACSDAYKDFKDAVVRRLGNPIFFTFLFSWCLVNWRLIAMLCFSKLAMVQRIKVIEEQYINLSNNFLLPLAFTLLYLVGMPWVLAGYSWISGFATNKRHKFECTQETIRIDQEEGLAQKQFYLTKIRTGNKSLEEMQQELNETTTKLADSDIHIKSLEQQQSIFHQEYEDLKKASENVTRVKEQYREQAKDLEKKQNALLGRESELIDEIVFFKEGYNNLMNDYKKVTSKNKAYIKEIQQLEKDLSRELAKSIEDRLPEKTTSSMAGLMQKSPTIKAANSIADLMKDSPTIKAATSIAGLMQESPTIKAANSIAGLMKDSPTIKAATSIAGLMQESPTIKAANSIADLTKGFPSIHDPANKWIPKK